MRSEITPSDVKELFIRQGWNKDIELEELSMQDVQDIGSYSMEAAMLKGHKFFRMKRSGNIFDSKGNIVIYNVPVIKNK